jgi:hypothetical protein
MRTLALALVLLLAACQQNPTLTLGGDPLDSKSGDGGPAGGDGESGVCPAIDDLPLIGGNEGPFTLCQNDADCEAANPDYQHRCLGADEGERLGYCDTPDSDSFCDGDQVNLQTNPPTGDGPGMCVRAAWRDYLCCFFPSQWDCGGVTECGPIEELPEIGGNEGSFALCDDDADCQARGDNQHICHHAEGKLGLCHVPDADSTCDGEGDVRLVTRPPRSEGDQGLCVPTEWRDYVCCALPDSFDCD